MIETQRLILRQWREEDKTPNYAMNSDPEVMKFFPTVLTKKESDHFVEKMTQNINDSGWGYWAVEEKKSAQFVGALGLWQPQFSTHFTPCTEIGWRIHRTFWKLGYATEGATAVLNFAFKKLELSEVVSFTSQQNLASIAVMKRIGMTRVPGSDFEHPNLEKDHPLSWHVLYHSKNPRLER